MGSHTFTSTPPDDQIIIDLVPPAGAASLTIHATYHPAASGSGATCRILHLRRKGSDKPAVSMISELLHNTATGIYTAAFSGFGIKHAHTLPQHLGRIGGAEVPITMTTPLASPGLEATIAVGSLSGHAVPDLVGVQKGGGHGGLVWAAGDALELVMGFTGAGDLKAPAGASITWLDDGSAVQWKDPNGNVMASPTVPAPVIAIPSAPPTGVVVPTPVPVPIPVPAVPPLIPGIDHNAQFKAELEALAIKYAASQGIDPLILGLLGLLIQRAGA